MWNLEEYIFSGCKYIFGVYELLDGNIKYMYIIIILIFDKNNDLLFIEYLIYIIMGWEELELVILLSGF